VRFGPGIAKPLALIILLLPAASALTLLAYWIYIYSWEGAEWYFMPLVLKPSINATSLYAGEYINVNVDLAYLPPWGYLNQTAYYYYYVGPYYSPEHSYYYNGTFYPSYQAYYYNYYYKFTVPRNISYLVLVNIYKLTGTASVLYYHKSFTGSIELNTTNGISIAEIHVGGVTLRMDEPGDYIVKIFVWTGYPSIVQELWAPLAEGKEFSITVLPGE